MEKELTPAQLKQQALARAKRFHHTIHVYANEEFREFCVPDFELKDHLEYNKTHRFGRGIWVDGKNVYAGYLSKKQIKRLTHKFIGRTMPTLSYPRG